MTTNLKSLIEDARTAGYEVRQDGESITITRPIGRRQERLGLVVYPDGSAFDVTVDLGVARAIRSYRTMRKVLGI